MALWLRFANPNTNFLLNVSALASHNDILVLFSPLSRYHIILGTGWVMYKNNDSLVTKHNHYYVSLPKLTHFDLCVTGPAPRTLLFSSFESSSCSCSTKKLQLCQPCSAHQHKYT